MYKSIKIKHDILIQSHGNYMEMKKFNYIFEIDIFRNSLKNNLGVLRGVFLMVWVSKKTMTKDMAKPCIG